MRRFISLTHFIDSDEFTVSKENGSVRVYPKAGVLIKFSSFLGFFELYRLSSNTQSREKDFFATFWGSLRFFGVF
jgi:hypothetical protein